MKTIINLAFTLAVCALAGCATSPQGQSAPIKMENLTNIDQAWWAAENQNTEFRAQAYLEEWGFGGTPQWNDNGTQRRVVMPQEKAVAECVTAVSPPVASARMVFAINEKGEVTHTFTDKSGYVAECIQKKLVGYRVPPPPATPFLLCTQYHKQASGDATHNCGPVGKLVSCENTGTSRTCTGMVRGVSSRMQPRMSPVAR